MKVKVLLVGAIAGAALMSLLSVAGVASAAALYNNGPNDNGNFTPITGAPGINGGHVTSDSFELTGAATVTSVNFVLMTDASEGTVPSVEWSITSQPDAGTVFGSGVGALTNVLVGHPPTTTGIDDYSSTFSTGSLVLGAGTYWLTLQNGVSPSGSVDIFWAESDGPSQASYELQSGSMPPTPVLPLTPANFGLDGVCNVPGANGDCSQSFAINGTPSAITGGVPEPAAWTMMLVGLFGMGGGLRLRRLRSVLTA
jgi:hypothetical protein